MISGDFSHLPADVRPVALWEDAARIAHIRAERWVQHATAERVLGFLHEAYTQPRTAYFVCEVDGKVVGGGGVAPLQDSRENICELRKMYFLPEGRGLGLGRRLLDKCIEAAKELGFDVCYLETFSTMHDAMALYEKRGFERIPASLGNTGHFACDQFYTIALQ